MKKLIFIIIICLVLCGCDSKKCIKSHNETRTSVNTSCIPIGNFQSCTSTPYTYTITVCDEYEEENNER